MANVTVNHNHSHIKIVSSARTLTDKNAGKDNLWQHSHYHSHGYCQDYGQQYMMEHSHIHQHSSRVPKHALIDLDPNERAIVREVLGKPKIIKHLADMGLRVNTIVSNIVKMESGYSVNIGEKTHSLTVQEAISIIVEVQ